MDVTEVVGMFLDNQVTVKISETNLFFTCFCYTDIFFYLFLNATELVKFSGGMRTEQ